LDAGSLVFMGMKIEKQAGDDLEAPTPPSQQDHDE
jgi:hypothetical protein